MLWTPRLTAGLIALFAAATAPAGAAGAAPADFDARWQSALAELPVLPPDALSADCPGEVSFPVTEVARADAAWSPGSDSAATPVVHVVETLADRRPPDWVRSHLYLAARGDVPLGAWLAQARPDARHGPTLSVLAACQAVNLVRSRPGATAPRVGLVGDGFGAQIALAAAALVPDRVAWLVLHEPRPALYRRPDGAPTACPELRAALAQMANAGDVAYLDPLSFAPQVRCPTFVTAGAADREALLSEIEALFAALTCPRDRRVIDHLGHCPSANLPDLAAILARMDGFAEGWHAARLTSP